MTIKELMNMANRHDKNTLEENLSYLKKREFGSVKDESVIRLMEEMGFKPADVSSTAYLIVIAEAYFVYRSMVVGLEAINCMSKKEESSDSELCKEKEETDED